MRDRIFGSVLILRLGYYVRFAGRQRAWQQENAGQRNSADRRSSDASTNAVIGQERVVERLVIALLTNGNVPLEGQTDKMSVGDAYQVTGTLKQWQDNVAALAVGNDRPALFLAASFTGPLLDV